jgi:Skp family chaperone for outer membrane proteins
MTGNITTKMPSLGILSPNQTNTQQAGNEFKAAVGEQKVAFAPAIPALGLAAIITVALVGCWGLVQNSAGNGKNGSSITLDDLDKLSRSLANLLQGKGDEDKFTPVARKVLANPEIRGKLEKAVGGTVLQAKTNKPAGKVDTKGKPAKATKKKGVGINLDAARKKLQNALTKNRADYKKLSDKLNGTTDEKGKTVTKSMNEKLKDFRTDNPPPHNEKQAADYKSLVDGDASIKNTMRELDATARNLESRLKSHTTN